jgi:mono/diheme cytochrome c family protein
MISRKLIAIFFIYTISNAGATDWSSKATLPGVAICETIHGHEVCLTKGNRKNILNLEPEHLKNSIYNGGKHVLNYPVTVTRLRIPKDTMEKFFNSDTNSPIRKFIFKVAKKLTSFKSFNDIFDWMGLHEYPELQSEVGENPIPYMGDLESYHMGVSEFNDHGSKSLSFSCAACHSSNLFGTKVIGLTNRFSRANETFILGKKILLNTPAFIFKLLVSPTDADYQTFKTAKKAMEFVTTKKPLALGLDTSLAQVGLSLAMRAQDEYASLIKQSRVRKNPLDKIPADSKPAVWWNLKYKTRWLSDGSIISGNPVHTNFLWNEIGRGVNLRELESWLTDNDQKVAELTSYVFNTEPPSFNKYFPNRIVISKAQAGEKLFLKNCKGCHGIYNKGWSDLDSAQLSYEENIKTTEVWYHKKTKVVDVGTDSHRHQGMKHFAKDLNRLKISKTIGTVVTPQIGYVPPPLVGIWSRWPYFHNNSVPSLYDVLTPSLYRPKTYISVPAESKTTDFDLERNGYPKSNFIREPFRSDPEFKFDTRIKGLSNSGHSKMMKDDDGKPKFNHTQKLELIEFLKTL